MARGQRSLHQHGWFHITDRGVDRQDVFIDDRERAALLHEFVDAAKRFGVEVHAYCILTTHFHAVVNCPDGGLSAFMQRVLQRFAVGHNRRLKREGYVFTGRFRSDPIGIDDDEATEALQQVCRYVHRNPLDFMPLGDLRSYPWSSYPVYTGSRKAPDWLATDVLFGAHGDDRWRIVEFTESPHPTDRTPAHGRLVDPYSPLEVIGAVAAVGGLEVDDVIRLPRNGPSTGLRSVAAYLCRRLRTASCDELATLFALGSSQAFRNLANRGKDRCAIDQRLEALADRAVQVLWATTTGDGFVRLQE